MNIRQCVIWIAVFCATTTLRAEDPVGRKWPASQRISMDRIDHQPLTDLLAEYVDEDGYVAYRKWQNNKEARTQLQAYLASLGRADRRAKASGSARIAFWINAYNALTIEGILKVYPTSSIRNHTARVFGYNIWKQLPLIVGDGQYSLDQIEHEILRKMHEPRIHFAIVCASVGCPRLRNEAYTAENLETQLADNAVDFFSRSQNFRYDAKHQTVYLSSIMKWFGTDFGASESAQLRAVNKYLPEDVRATLASSRPGVQFLDYDWSINDQSQRVTKRGQRRR